MAKGIYKVKFEIIMIDWFVKVGILRIATDCA